MRQTDVRQQLDAAVSNMESALKDLSERLEDALPGSDDLRHRVTRAKRAIRRGAGSVADHVTPPYPSLVEETRRTVRDHPVRVALTAAMAGYCVWSLLRLANGRASLRGNSHSLSDRFRSSQKEGFFRH
ncbi:MAG: hypothetical protein ACREQ8_01335 [Woeseiaceae bacterium]